MTLAYYCPSHVVIWPFFQILKIILFSDQKLLSLIVYYENNLCNLFNFVYFNYHQNKTCKPQSYLH